MIVVLVVWSTFHCWNDEKKAVSIRCCEIIGIPSLTPRPCYGKRSVVLCLRLFLVLFHPRIISSCVYSTVIFSLCSLSLRFTERLIARGCDVTQTTIFTRTNFSVLYRYASPRTYCPTTSHLLRCAAAPFRTCTSAQYELLHNSFLLGR